MAPAEVDRADDEIVLAAEPVSHRHPSAFWPVSAILKNEEALIWP